MESASARSVHPELRLGGRAPRARELELRLALIEPRLRRDAVLRELLQALVIALLLDQRGVALGDARARAVALERAALGVDQQHGGALLGGAALVDHDLGDASTDLRGDLRPLLREQLSGRLDAVHDVDGSDAVQRHGRSLGRLLRRRACRRRRARAASATTTPARNLTTPPLPRAPVAGRGGAHESPQHGRERRAHHVLRPRVVGPLGEHRHHAVHGDPQALRGLLDVAREQPSLARELRERPLDQRARLQRGLRRLGRIRPVGREQLDPPGVAQAEAHEGAGDRQQRLAGIVAAPRALHRGDHAPEALLEQRVEQALLVAEVVIDGGRRVAAALGEAAHREGLEALLDQQRLGGVEDGAPRVLAVLEPAALGGGLGGRGVHVRLAAGGGISLEHRESVVTMLQKNRQTDERP